MMNSVPPSRPPDSSSSSSSDGVPSQPSSNPSKPFNLPPSPPQKPVTSHKRPTPQPTPFPKPKTPLPDESRQNELAALKKKNRDDDKEKDDKKTKKGEGLVEMLPEPKLSLGGTGKEIQGTTPVSATAAKEGVQKISQLILKLVENMRVGTVGGQNFASMDLKKTPEIPHYFANATLTLTQTDKGVVIRFSNFDSPQSQNLAISAVENNKSELSQLMRNLQNRNINVADLQVGDHSVALPAITATPQGEGAAYYERGGEGGQGGGGGGQGEGEPRKDERNKGER